MNRWGKAFVPFSISPLQSHRHPLQMVSVLIDAFPFKLTGQEDGSSIITETDVTRIWRRSHRIRPDDHVLSVLRRVVAARKFHQHPPTGFRIIGRSVGVVQWHPEKPTNVPQIVLALIGQLGS